MPAHIIGDFNTQPNIGYPREYFDVRETTLDCRYPDAIKIHPTACLSLGDHIITLSHRSSEGGNGTLVERPVQIDAGAWIGMYVTLYNCHIGEGAVVGIGSVVASRDVPPNVMAEGNPAQIVAVKENGHWEYLEDPVPLKRRTE